MIIRDRLVTFDSLWIRGDDNQSIHEVVILTSSGVCWWTSEARFGEPAKTTARQEFYVIFKGIPILKQKTKCYKASYEEYRKKQREWVRDIVRQNEETRYMYKSFILYHFFPLLFICTYIVIIYPGVSPNENPCQWYNPHEYNHQTLWTCPSSHIFLQLCQAMSCA